MGSMSMTLQPLPNAKYLTTGLSATEDVEGNFDGLFSPNCLLKDQTEPFKLFGAVSVYRGPQIITQDQIDSFLRKHARPPLFFDWLPDPLLFMDDNISVSGHLHSVTLLANSTSILPLFERLLDKEKPGSDHLDLLQSIVSEYSETDLPEEEEQEIEEKEEVME